MTERAGICPNCGAQVEFRWAGAVQTTCGSCRSVLVRTDADLKKVGQVSEVPASASRIQLGTTGKFKGKPFEVVGRIVYRYGRGTWSEWHFRMGNESGWLSDAQGEYVVTFQDTKVRKHLEEDRIGVGGTMTFNDVEYEIATKTKASYVGVEGELPFEYWDKDECTFVDIKSGTDKFGTIDFSEDKPLFFFGEYESFEDLRLQNLRDVAEADATIPTKSLSCATCAAAIELNLGDLTATVACKSCGSIMEPGDDGLRVIASQEKLMRTMGRPKIPLGSVGNLKGVSWKVIGFQVREITVVGVGYRWREYLLWNADNGYKYLTEYDDHWNEVTTLKGVPTEGPHEDGKSTVDYLGTRFRHFQNSTPKVKFVLGEFPWEVRVNDTVQNDDYVAPPLMLSREQSADEVTWSIGTYTYGYRLTEAFKLRDELPPAHGIFANEPSPLAGLTRGYMKIMSALVLVLALGFCGRQATARNETVFQEYYRYDGDTNAFVTPVFDLQGGTGNVEISLETSLDNDWAYFNLALLADDGSRGYELGREVSYYSGIDDGERWSEGRSGDRSMVAAVPEGKYFLRVDIDRDMLGKPFSYRLTVKRDVPRIWPYLIGLLLIAIPTVFAWVRERQFEFNRWQESDYAVEESDDDDDE